MIIVMVTYNGIKSLLKRAKVVAETETIVGTRTQILKPAYLICELSHLHSFNYMKLPREEKRGKD